MIRFRPVTHVTGALVLLTCCVALTAQLAWQIIPDPSDTERRVRQSAAEALAVQSLVMLERGEIGLLTRTLESVRRNQPGIRSIAVRKADGTLVAQTAGHAATKPRERANDQDTFEVALRAPDGEWGRLEMAYMPRAHNALRDVLNHPMTILIAHFLILGAALYWFYLKRTLVYLDPASVIPERIRRAFDAMTEGIAVLDRQGRIVLVNSAFHSLLSAPWPDVLGKRLSALPWLASGLPNDPGLHPWAKVLTKGESSTGNSILIGSTSATPRHVVMNCAAITDAQGNVKGCIVTFDDLSALHHANERLAATLAELNISQSELQRKHMELEFTATHDSLSGCLTRRAGLARVEAMLPTARSASEPLSCFILDIDQFKAVNDGFGHAMGDRVVTEVGATLLATIRDADIVARYGGDEFIVFMPRCDLAAASARAESVRAAVARNCKTHIEALAGFGVTVSIGVAQWDPASMSESATLIQQADAALYRAKAAGRNQVCQGTELPTTRAKVDAVM